jgi:hypothetical protein
MENDIRNAVIRKADILVERGILTVWLHLELGSGGQAFGGYCLHSLSRKDYRVTDFGGHAGHFIMRVMEVVGVEHWDELKGKAVRIRGDSNRISTIGNFIKDEWFNPMKEFAVPEKNTEN